MKRTRRRESKPSPLTSSRKPRSVARTKGSRGMTLLMEAAGGVLAHSGDVGYVGREVFAVLASVRCSPALRKDATASSREYRFLVLFPLLSIWKFCGWEPARLFDESCAPECTEGSPPRWHFTPHYLFPGRNSLSYSRTFACGPS